MSNEIEDSAGTAKSGAPNWRNAWLRRGFNGLVVVWLVWGGIIYFGRMYFTIAREYGLSLPGLWKHALSLFGVATP